MDIKILHKIFDLNDNTARTSWNLNKIYRGPINQKEVIIKPPREFTNVGACSSNLSEHSNPTQKFSIRTSLSSLLPLAPLYQNQRKNLPK